MDPDDGMRAEGERIARERGINNIEWRFGGSKDLSPALGQFRLVTMGNSFHWMDRARTLDALYDLVTDGGGIAVVGEGAPIPPPPMTPWRAAINTVLKRYLGRPAAALGESGSAARRASRGIHRAFALQRSRQLPGIVRRRMDHRLDDRESLLDVVLQPASARRSRRCVRARAARSDSGGRALGHSQGRAARVFRLHGVEALSPSGFDAPLERAVHRAILCMIMSESPNVSA